MTTCGTDERNDSQNGVQFGLTRPSSFLSGQRTDIAGLKELMES